MDAKAASDSCGAGIAMQTCRRNERRGAAIVGAQWVGKGLHRVVIGEKVPQIFGRIGVLGDNGLTVGNFAPFQRKQKIGIPDHGVEPIIG